MKNSFIYKIIFATIILIIIIFILFNLDILPKTGNYELYSPFKNIISSDENNSFQKINDNIPKIDSAIASYPFVSKLIESTIDKNSYNDELQYVPTPQAYQNIIENKVDFSIASETNKYQRSFIENDPDIKLIPIAKEALVFYTNKDNPIKSLTINELNDIYGEEISNWNLLGGEDLRIFPYQQNKNIGGSEECFAQVVTNNTSFTNSEYIAYDMNNIIDLTAKNKGGIGYAFNMFCTKLYNSESIKLISINDIFPSYENIVTGKYPLMYNVYFVYRESNTNPNIKKILDWLLSTEGQELVAKNGYQPIK